MVIVEVPAIIENCPIVEEAVPPMVTCPPLLIEKRFAVIALP